jgi:hypothetical protein
MSNEKIIITPTKKFSNINNDNNQKINDLNNLKNIENLNKLEEIGKDKEFDANIDNSSFKINTRKDKSKSIQKNKRKKSNKKVLKEENNSDSEFIKLKSGINYDFSNLESILKSIELNTSTNQNNKDMNDLFFEENEIKKLNSIPSFHKWFKVFYSKHLSRKISSSSEKNTLNWTSEHFYKYFSNYSLPNLTMFNKLTNNFGPLICRVYETNQIDYYYLLRVHDLFGNYACLVIDDSTDNIGLFNGIKAMMHGDLLIIKSATYLYTQAIRMSFFEIFLSIDGNKENYIIIN